ncbi:MAG: molecular chaperone DnaK [Hyphomicrobiales bacterium]|nr:MAG: molecular chaperone DnaK [Hyphomicrobiales bacterium]
MTDDDTTIRNRLIARREELQALADSAAEARGPVTLDQQSVGRLSRMDAMQQQAMAQANDRARTAELSRIDAALHRLAEGEYGYCLDCGDEIAEKRLQIDPTAALCIACAASREK